MKKGIRIIKTIYRDKRTLQEKIDSLLEINKKEFDFKLYFIHCKPRNSFKCAVYP